MGTFLRGWALAEQGQRTQGIAHMRQGLAAIQATGQEAAQPRYLIQLAASYGKEDESAEGLRVLTEAMALIEKNSESNAKAELWRLKGELLLQQLKIKNGE